MKNIRKLKTEQRGITLIALVVTIVVLLILAGITINMLFSENGIITKAKQAAEETAKAEENEITGMQNVTNEINNIIESNKNTGITNPYDSDGWDVAWTCIDGTWSDEIPAGTAISDDVDIVAKFYKQDNVITPPTLDFYGKKYPFKEGNEYKLVIEGQGDMGTLMATTGTTITEAYAWQLKTAAFMAEYSDTCLIAYVTEVTICDGITVIGDYAFIGDTSLEKIIIGKDVTHIDEAAFAWGYSITELAIPKNIKYIGERVFASCKNLETIEIPDGITIIEVDTFWQCSNLKNVILPETITTISDYAFSNCIGLESITIPNSVIGVEDKAFYNCTGIKKVKILSTDTENLSISRSTFNDMASDSTIYVLNEEIKTKLEGSYDTTKTTVQVVTQEEMDNL